MKITVTPEILDAQTIKLTETIEGESPLTRFVREVSIERVNLKDKAIRECLIQLGWTPPTGSDQH